MGEHSILHLLQEESVSSAINFVVVLLFIFGLAGFSSAKTALSGLHQVIIGMVIASLMTLLLLEQHTIFVLLFLLVSLIIGSFWAKKVGMTQMPEMVALLNGFGGAGSALFAFSVYYGPEKLYHQNSSENILLALSVFVGVLTLFGSLVAYGKLSGKLTSKPRTLPFRHAISIVLLLLALVLGVLFVVFPKNGNLSDSFASIFKGKPNVLEEKVTVADFIQDEMKSGYSREVSENRAWYMADSMGFVSLESISIAMLSLSEKDKKEMGKTGELECRQDASASFIDGSKVFQSPPCAQFSTHSIIRLQEGLLWALALIAALFGVLLILAIGGADMPVVIAMLNAYSGIAVALAGFLYRNDLLVMAGAMVGSSGAILSYTMTKAMNRPFMNVIMGGFGAVQNQNSQQEGTYQPIEPQATAEMLSNAKEIIVVPGYGMAVSQAQHAIEQLSRKLEKLGARVRFAVHPVAGRMPGHMNVLLAEAKIPYDSVLEMDEINPEMEKIDCVLVVGANDTVNPDAKENPESPIAGMPVVEVWRAKNVIVSKRSMASGYAGVPNPLFYKENVHMLFGDAKASLEAVVEKITI